jgi:hypothetical protein
MLVPKPVILAIKHSRHKKHLEGSFGHSDKKEIQEDLIETHN